MRSLTAVGSGVGRIPADVRRAAAAARRAVARLARPAGEFDASRYFRGASRLGFYNAGTGRVRALAREIALQHPGWTADDAVTFADLLIADRYLEVKGVAVETLARFRRRCQPRHLRVWKRWLASNAADNWATTDAICGMLIGPLLLAHPELVRGMAAWAHSRNLWVRRAAIVGLLAPLRRHDVLDDVYAIAGVLHKDEADLIQKAVGWALREAGKVDPRRLERYLRANGNRIPRTTIRYAIERFPTARRAALLAATRADG